ncbi:hypothetical protein [Chryseobacterium sp. NKUCC03_KSP]|uniref:hypothetical protein n=1 Tax=Chryseobacterium sp. NKUCC03_KSP TaxID=2842125 RepID=UPI001C5B5D77|nr:hypothetical protein [Chryseobacterium sp. NKUCC03_KSP]MBW3521814.1 hypothetical protein [Chryseobacterium sp. NKUCC03_KSP]
MKNIILSSIFTVFLFSFFSSCASVKENKQKDIFVNQFVNNDGILNSLESFYNLKTITIYDENKVLVEQDKTFNISSRIVNIVLLKPQNDQYLSIKNFILNQNLVCLTFLTSDREEGVVFYLKRKSNKDEWQISNMFKQQTR